MLDSDKLDTDLEEEQLEMLVLLGEEQDEEEDVENREGEDEDTLEDIELLL